MAGTNNDAVITAYLELVGETSMTDVQPVIELKVKQVTLGRATENTCVWPWPQISRKHAKFEYNDKLKQWTLIDMSANGMTVNNCAPPKHVPVALHNGDLISFHLPSGLQYRFSIENVGEAHLEESLSLYQTVLNVPPTPTEKLLQFRICDSSMNPACSSQQRRDIGLMSVARQPHNRNAAAHLPSHLPSSSAEERWCNAYDPERGVFCIDNDEEFECFAGFKRTQELYDVKNHLTKFRDRIETLEREKKQLLDAIESERVAAELEIQTLAMARNQLQERIVENIGTELECAICKGVLTEATVIDCGHTFCLECISEWMRRKFECPTCRKPLQHLIKAHALQNYLKEACAALNIYQNIINL